MEADNQQPAKVDASLYREALELAYPLAVESYKQAERRLDVVEKRLQDLMAFGVTATLGVVAVCAGKVNLLAWQFYVAMACCVLGLLVGIFARLSGSVILIAPQKLYDNYLVYNADKFKLVFIGYAGEDDAQNRSAIKKKADLTNWVATFFLCEAVLLGMWALQIFGFPQQVNSGQRPSQAVEKRVAPKVQGR